MPSRNECVVICPMCGQPVAEHDYAPGMRKCINCMVLIKQVRAERPEALCSCLRIIYNKLPPDGCTSSQSQRVEE